MLVKEAIIKIARELKDQEEKIYQDGKLFNGYPEDLNQDDIKKAMVAIASVSDAIVNLY
jgi:hypothetical protein